MSMSEQIKVSCQCCQQQVVQQPYGKIAYKSNNSSFDFDGRPTGFARDNFKSSLQYCSNCCLVAPQLNDAQASFDLLQSIPYQLQIADESMPLQARVFLCYGILMEDCGKYFKAAESALFAAWVCDDEKNQRQAQHCRQQSASLFALSIEKGQVEKPRLIDCWLLLADLYRRALDFEKAKEMVLQGLNEEQCTERQQKCAQFQLMLINEKDAACYSYQIFEK